MIEQGAEAMEDVAAEVVSERRPYGLPETIEEAEQLAATIERAVQLETGHEVVDLMVEVNAAGVLLRGHCETYYTKQLAQHAAMRLPGGDRLTNSIEVD